jgi:hypothetical protein
VINRKVKSVALCLGHDRKVSLKLTQVVEPVINVNPFKVAAADDVDDSKVVALLDVDVAFVVECRKDKAEGALNQEVDLFYLVSVNIYMLVMKVDLRLEQRTHPSYKVHVFVFKELELTIALFIHVSRELDL